MKDFVSLGLRCVNQKLEVLDQTLLPHQEVWIHCQTPEQMVSIIQNLQTRGAPLIGVAAAMALALFAEQGASPAEILTAAKKLHNARPTAVNLMLAMNRMVLKTNEALWTAKHLVQVAQTIFDEDVLLCKSMGAFGAELVCDGDHILTHCNTGGLATAGIGTALAVIRTAHEQGKNVHVYVDETRPLLQGGRLTTWELQKLQIPYTLICDNMAATLMRAKKIQRAFVGADRIAVNGDFANKIGTYSVAVNCHFHHVPFYPVAPYTTVDLQCPSGAHIPIEERAPNEVRGFRGVVGNALQEIVWSPSAAYAFNPSFDVTPVSLISGLVLDSGVFTPAQIAKGEHLEREAVSQ